MSGPVERESRETAEGEAAEEPVSVREEPVVCYAAAMREAVMGRESETRSVEERRVAPLPALVTVKRAGGAVTPPFRLKRGSCVIGAGSSADLLIEDDTVSRAHVRLEVVPEGVLVEDLNSRNGTFYLGQRIERMTLALGATIRLGTVEVTIEPDRAVLSPSEGGPDRYGDLVTGSPTMRGLFATLQRLEGSLASVLILGESGTGKELIARAIHNHSSVAEGPFIAVNCGALQRDLVRSELFGHKRGAFTGALQEHRGAFRAADGGTLFLDEIGDLPAEVQPMLLRALEERAIVPVGGTQAEPVKVRVLAATHKALDESVRAGTLREDLYYRLVVVTLNVPSLRERREDVPVLARLFAERFGAAELPDEVMAALCRHSWPGNVRELRHAVESYVAIGQLPPALRPRQASEGDVQRVLGSMIDLEQDYQTLKEQFLNQFTSAYLERLMDHCGGNVSQAARLSGLERSYLNKLAHKYGVRR